MKKTAFFIITSLFLVSAALAADSQIWGEMMIPNILDYGKEGSLDLGPLFTLLQGTYFRWVFLAITVGVPTIFLVHYLVWGPKVFSHGGDKIYIFSLFQRIVHLLAVISFLVLVPTGLMMVFGRYLGGGTPVYLARNLHAMATVVFFIAVFPMFLCWCLDMLPSTDDIKWVFILGGYLSKKKREIPAGKFNAGQKMWFWVATLGGMVMIATGLMMYFQDFNLGIARTLGLSQIDLLRGAAIVHNVLAALITAFFFTHAYMSLFAIKGAIHSIITGYKEEEEVKYLHSSYYKKLQQQRAKS
ncbi:MAG: formate dehydrogenase subunit gamma [Deltaproteobacteria bacterium]|nr:MAG: formate dehydrogenase subunit gamma [Deltaproteobacteria bacterium]PIE73323.1 MAG: formate dehydrogenase subunit gamma [Deltaproteobacteria bacterium]